MHRTRLTPVAPLLFLSLLVLIAGCIVRPHATRFLSDCYQDGPEYTIGVDVNNRVSKNAACVKAAKKQTIRWRRTEGTQGFRIRFDDPTYPIKPIDQECRNECRAEIVLSQAHDGQILSYCVTDLTTGRISDPVIIIDTCCGP